MTAPQDIFGVFLMSHDLGTEDADGNVSTVHYQSPLLQLIWLVLSDAHKMDSMHLVGSGSRHYAPYDWSSSTKFTFVISQSQKALINCTSLSFGIIWKNEHNFCTFSQSSTVSIIGIFLVFGREHYQNHDLLGL